MDSVYTPDGTYALLLLLVALSLVGAVAYLLVFAGASLLP